MNDLPQNAATNERPDLNPVNPDQRDLTLAQRVAILESEVNID